MSESKFTPGPWRVGSDLCRVHPNWRDEGGNLSKDAAHRNGYAKTIATVANENHDWRDIGAQVADAHLIAAAPELYEALRQAIGIIEAHVPQDALGMNGDPRDGMWPLLDEYRHYMNTALAKARGEA